MAGNKDTWDKWDIILRPVGGMLTALSVALVGFFGSQYLAGQQERDANSRLYTELMSSRERSDSALRQEMFRIIITTFLKEDEHGNRDVRDEILALELLAYNFHDAIDIGPLFNHVKSNVDRQEESLKNSLTPLMKRLERVAKEVTSKQLASLEDGGVIIDDAYVTFDDLLSTSEKGAISAVAQLIEMPGAGADKDPDVPPRKFYLDVLGANLDRKTLDVWLEVMTENGEETLIGANFEVGFYDFPMIDNSRLPGGQRVAVALRDWEPGSHVQLALAYFPSSRASLKEKLFYEEIVEQLQSTQQQFYEE